MQLKQRKWNPGIIYVRLFLTHIFHTQVYITDQLIHGNIVLASVGKI